MKITEINKEKLKQIISRTDKTGNEKFDLLVDLIEGSTTPPSDEEIGNYVDKELSYIHDAVRCPEFDLGFRTGIVAIVSHNTTLEKQVKELLEVTGCSDLNEVVEKWKENEVGFALWVIEQIDWRWHSSRHLWVNIFDIRAQKTHLELYDYYSNLQLTKTAPDSNG